jgi:HEAT repeat protein
MRTVTFATIVLIAAYAVIPAVAMMPVTYTTLELIEEANLVVLGTVRSVNDEVALVSVDCVLDGTLNTNEITIAPSRLQEGWLSQTTIFAPGDEVVLLLKIGSKGSTPTIIGHGSGKISLSSETKAEVTEAVRKLIQITRMTDDDKKDRAMLAEAASKNSLLRSNSHSYISGKISHSKLRQNYKDSLVNLLNSMENDVKLAALRGLQFVSAEEAIPQIIQATEHTDAQLAQAASLALAQYDTPETVAALIAMTTRHDKDLTARALIDLSYSRRPEAKNTIVSFLDDENSSVRATSASALIFSLRRKVADEAIPKLISLLQDPDDDVRFNAACALGESRSPIAVEPLISVLRTGDPNTRSYAKAVDAISMLDIRDASARKIIQDNLPLIAKVLEQGTQHVPLYAIGILAHLRTPEAIAIIREAAGNHPSLDARSSAKRTLEWLEKQYGIMGD